MTNGARGTGTRDQLIDDWFEKEGGIEWGPADAGESAARPRREQEPEPGGPGAPEPAAVHRADEPQLPRSGVSDTVWRRRAILLIALTVLVALAIAVPLVAREGGGGGSEQTATTLPGSASDQTGTQAQSATSPPPPAAAANPAPGPSPPPAATKPTPTIVVELPATGSLRRGDAGESVVTLQKALAALEFDPGSPDGDYGAKTAAAVIAFQTANGLDPDGVVGEKTASKLNAALSTSSLQ